MDEQIRVLIADDQPRARRGLCAVLATSGLKAGQAHPAISVVGEAADGLQVIQLVETCQPDVVLMDAHMPQVDGLQATRLIKRRWPAVRVIMLTLYANYRTAAISASADDFLLKGCDAADLLNAIQNKTVPQVSTLASQSLERS